jgi:hypothetical protein
MSRILLHWTIIAGCALSATAVAAEKPAIRKLGTLECDMVEATPVVFHGRLYYFQYVRGDYAHKAPGFRDSYFRFWDVDKSAPTAPFAAGSHLGSACATAERMFVYGVDRWGAGKVRVFWSDDLAKWRSAVALDLAGWGIFNTSVCRADGRFVMAFEINAPPEETGVAFTTRFAESADGISWKLLPSKCVFSKERYTACPSLRFYDGAYYMTYLETRPGPTYETFIVRSADLVSWETSPLNPVLTFSDTDRKIANPRLNQAERERIAKAKNINSSDLDFCHHQGKTILLYSWGNQQGVEHLALAEFDGSEKSFLKGFFPK